MHNGLTRRGLLAVGFGLWPVVALAGAGELKPSDRFQYRTGHEVWWAGWRSPANQVLEFGFWVATHPRAARRFVASTTLGMVGEYGELDAIDLSRREGWSVITPMSAETDRVLVKARALTALLRELDATGVR